MTQEQPKPETQSKLTRLEKVCFYGGTALLAAAGCIGIDVLVHMPAVVHAFPWLNNNPFRLHTELWSIEIKGCTNNVATHFIGLKDYVLDFVNGFQEYSCVE